MNNKLIIFFTAFFLLVSFVFLSYTEKKQADINSKNLWMVYFASPKNNSLDFTIENHSDTANFHWEILSDKEKIKDGDIAISKGNTKTIPVVVEGVDNKKITITVTDTTNKEKEISKNF